MLSSWKLTIVAGLLLLSSRDALADQHRDAVDAAQLRPSANAFAAAADDRNAVEERVITLRLVDEQQRPVAGAQATWDYELDKSLPEGGSFVNPQTSDETGIVRLRMSQTQSRTTPLYVRHSTRHLVAVSGISVKETDQQSSVVDVTMHPECRVSLKVGCRQLEQRRIRPTKGMALYIYQDNSLAFISYLDLSESSCDVILPPGNFRFETYGKGFHSAFTKVEIPHGEHQLDLGIIDHEPKQLALLEGLPAPELPQGLVWKNSLPLKLKQLRGQVVLLEFWGWWCGPCVYRSIPAMMKIEDEYAEKDLTIIGVHSDRRQNEVDTVDKLDQKLEMVRQTRWEGRDIPFPVVMVPANPVRFGNSIRGEALNAYAAKYGIDGYPTAILIDKQGNVVGEFSEYRPDHLDRLKRLIESK